MTLEVNEITILMAIISVGILTIIGLCVYMVVDGIFGKDAITASENHFIRS